MTPKTETEVCVLGGGPAGAVIARRLAQLGHDTILIDRSVQPSQPRVESLAPSILPILDSLGLRDCLAAAAFLRETRALIRWSTADVEERSFDAPSSLVVRSRFDARLREAASVAGARVMSKTIARAAARRSGGWTIPVKTPTGPLIIESAFLVDARGKRAGGNVKDQHPRTVAISGIWKHADPSFAQTRIDAGTDEWFWGSPVAEGLYSAAVFVDASRAAGLNSARRADLYRRLVSRSRLLKGLLRGQLTGMLTTRDATGSISQPLIENDFIRVGEAAFSIDPLSSQGIQTAILSAVQGSAAVHTILTGAAAEPAIEFYHTSQQRAASQAARHAAQHHGSRQHSTASSFWRQRSQGVAEPSSKKLADMSSRAPLPARVRVSPALQIIETPVLTGSLVELSPALCHPGLDAPVAYLKGIPLAPLIADVRHMSGSEEIVALWAQRLKPEPAQNMLRWMCAVGIMVPAT
jgi:flavin-dependent dehydrogenase